jgi:hypothetical protein
MLNISGFVDWFKESTLPLRLKQSGSLNLFSAKDAKFSGKIFSLNRNDYIQRLAPTSE